MKIPTHILAPLMLTLLLAGCQGSVNDLVPNGGANAPLPAKLVQSMKAKGMAPTSPIMVRIFKEENVLEVWKRKNNGRYDIVTSYQICKWSGKLGPKFIEGDRQAPEGYYSVRAAQMNPKSSYYLSFNTGYPNALDRALGRTGANLMVHGACSSSGCYSMTDAQVAQIYAFAREAFKGGQESIQLQAYPFRMTAANMARYRDDPNYA
ncbi:MAG: L,D-transpeptidase family protein, partial [Phyllobacterium sp.]